MFRGLSKIIQQSRYAATSNLMKSGLTAVPRANLNQVQNMLEENLKYDA